MPKDRNSGQQFDQPRCGSEAGGQYRFARSHRLRKNKEFRKIYEGGRNYPARSMVLWMLPSEEPAVKAGVVASRRMFRRAVDRNRAKRLLRESLRHVMPELNPGTRLVMIARRGILNTPPDEIAKDLRWLLRRAGVLLCAEC